MLESDMSDDFPTFLETVRRPAASAFVAGDSAPVERLSAQGGQAIFFDPGAASPKARRRSTAPTAKALRNSAPAGPPSFRSKTSAKAAI